MRRILILAAIAASISSAAAADYSIEASGSADPFGPGYDAFYSGSQFRTVMGSDAWTPPGRSNFSEASASPLALHAASSGMTSTVYGVDASARSSGVAISIGDDAALARYLDIDGDLHVLIGFGATLSNSIPQEPAITTQATGDASLRVSATTYGVAYNGLGGGFSVANASSFHDAQGTGVLASLGEEGGSVVFYLPAVFSVNVYGGLTTYLDLAVATSNYAFGPTASTSLDLAVLDGGYGLFLNDGTPLADTGLTVTIAPRSVPEPASFALLGLGTALALAYRMRAARRRVV